MDQMPATNATRLFVPSDAPYTLLHGTTSDIFSMRLAQRLERTEWQRPKPAATRTSSAHSDTQNCDQNSRDN
jgi:hypothetical protein